MPTNRAFTFLVLATTGLLTGLGAAPAHAQKVAIVASEAIFDRLPDAKSARAKLAETHTGWMREIQRQETDIQRLRDDIQANRLLWSTAEQEDARVRYADMESKLASFRAGKYGQNGEFEKMQTELMGPVQEKVAKAIDEEAKSQKYDVVLDKSSRATLILYVNPSFDITYQVLKRLGVDVPQSEINAATDPTAAGSTSGKGGEANALRNRGRRDEPTENVTIDPNDLLKGGAGEVQPPDQQQTTPK